MTNANLLRQVQWLWKHRHKSHDDIETRLTIIETREENEPDSDDTPPATAAYIHLTRNASQTIAVSGEAVSWDTEHPLIDPVGFASPTLPVTEVTIPFEAYYGVKFESKWATYTDGGTVEIRRERASNTVRLWPTDDDPDLWTATDGQKFSGIAVIPAKRGDKVSVFLDADDASSQSLESATLTIYKIETSLLRQFYKAVVLAAGPLAYWRLDETSGTTLNDIAGHASGPFDMTTSGTPTLGQVGLITDGSGNDAVDFEEASNQYALAVESATLKFLSAQAFTVEAWIKPESYREGSGDTTRTIISCFFSNTGGSDEDGWRLGWSSTADTGPLSFFVERQNATTVSQATTGADYATGKTFHVVGTYDGTTLKIYVDGALVDSDTTSVSIPNGDQTQCAIAATESGTPGDWTSFGQGDGTYDEIALYTRALSDTEILEHYNVGRGA